jgi:hypothetical protein
LIQDGGEVDFQVRLALMPTAIQIVRGLVVLL